MAEKATKAEKKKPAENVLPLFGASIEEAAKRSDREHGAIPLPIKSAVEYLNQRGMNPMPFRRWQLLAGPFFFGGGVRQI